MTTRATILRNATIVPGPRDRAPFLGDVGIEGSRIAFVRPADGGADALPTADADVVDLTGQVVLPGLVNAHLHAVPALFRAAFAAIRIDDHATSALVGRLYEALVSDEEAIELGARLCLAEAAMAGATSVSLMEYLDPVVAARVAADLGLRGAMSVYPKEPSWEEDLERVRELGFTPMLWAPNEDDPDFTDEFLREIAGIAAARGLRVHMHVSETVARRDASLARCGETPVAYLDRIGLLPHLYAVHCTVLAERDVELLAAHDVPVVITPVSEALLADGVTPLARLRDAGVTVALGTDGGPWAGGEDLFAEMKATALLNRAHAAPDAITGADLIEMATVNGALVLGCADVGGTIEPGLEADLVVLDGNAPHLLPMIAEGPLETVRDVLAFSARAADVSWVLAGGRTVYRRGGTPLLADDLMARTRAAALRVWELAGGPQAAAWLP